MAFDFIRSGARLLVCILSVCVIGGCAASTPNVSQDVNLGRGEGLLITKVHTNWRMIGIFISAENDTGSYVAKLSGPDGDLKVIPVKSGRVYFSRIVRYGFPYNYRVRLERSFFYIAPGTITYIGDLFINWKSEGSLGAGTTEVSLVDKEDSTVSEARKKYPKLFEKFLYGKNSSAIRKEDTERLPETRDLQL